MFSTSMTQRSQSPLSSCSLSASESDWLETVRMARRPAIKRACVEVLEERRLMSFTPAAEYPVESPFTVVTGDFNNDQKLDIATSDYVWGSVSVLPGNGDGTFQPPLTTAGSNVQSLAVGDFNEDGTLDLAVATISGAGVMLGNGDGTFQPAITTGVGSESIAVGDFNDDGTLDLGVTSSTYHNPYYGYGYWYGYGYYEGHLSVLIGNGDGTFNTPITRSTPGYLSSGIVADLNGDGVDDLAAANTDYGTIEILHGNAGGQPQSGASIGLSFLPAAIAAGDMDGDGDNDLVITMPPYYGSDFGLLLADGVGGFAPETRHAGAGGFSLTLSDFDNDSQLDVAIADSSNAVAIIRRNPDGSYGPPESFGVPNVRQVSAADLNGDGWADLATANYFSGTISVLMNDRAWSQPPPSVAINDVTVTEGNSGTVAATFTVTRSGDLAGVATVNYTTANGGALAGSDYVAKSGTLTFASGVGTMQVTVAVNGDLIDEYDQYFYVNLSAASGAVITDGQGSCLIVDNDPPPTISIIPKVSVKEGNGKGKWGSTTSFDFVVTLSAASEKAISVSYATADGTATIAGGDYFATSGALYFAPGITSRTITVRVIGDSTKESNETFTVNLNSPANADLLNSQGVGEILNDDKR